MNEECPPFCPPFVTLFVPLVNIIFLTIFGFSAERNSPQVCAQESQSANDL
jgi:hypothetical protein